ncbi:hypothetical protein GJ496_010219 [Pomphorhynchus laevis]|nr:hypothetical protein GJ496_010219 [Pomphorhynchus laevis]
MSNKSNLGRFEKGIFVTEHHEDVLHYIYRAIGSKSLPYSGNTLVHFDAHPDLSCPDGLQFNDIHDTEKVFSAVTAESWIMPCICTGHFDKMFWFKPPWSPQFIDGIYEFYIGRCPDTGLIKVSCKQNYFVCDGQFCPEKKLLDKVPFKMIVLTVGISENFNFLMSLVRCRPLDDSGFPGSQDIRRKLKPSESERSKDLSSFVTLIGTSEWVLDFDLDFFASQDPVKIALNAEENFALYRKVYCNCPASSTDSKLEDHMKRKAQEFLDMQHVYERYFDKRAGKDDKQKEKEKLLSEIDDQFAALIKTIDELDIDWHLIHDHGVSMGNSRLPHHQSSDEQINYLLSGTERILASIKCPPSIVTIARSVELNYCPTDKAPRIESLVLDRLKDLFPKLTSTVLDKD